MKDNKVLLEEVIRMIDMSEYNSKEKEFLKENVTKRYLKEEDDDDDYISFGDEEDYGDYESNDETEEEAKERRKLERLVEIFRETEKKLKEYVPSIENDKKYLTTIDKLILAYGSINAAQAALFELQKEDFVQLEDLKTDIVKPESEEGREGAVYYKGSKPLYSKSEENEFLRLTKRGRFILKVKGKEEEKIDQPLYKWLETRKYNLIKLRTGSKFSADANAQLNFLARLLSKKPLNDEIDETIINNANKAAETNAFNIMQSYYLKVCTNIIKGKGYEDSFVVTDAIDEGIASALANLMGTKGYVGKRTKMEETTWNPNRNVSAWFIQVVKNNVIDSIKKITKYKVQVDADVENYINLNSYKGKSGKNVIKVASKTNKSTNLTNNVTKDKEKPIWYHFYVDGDITATEKFNIDLQNNAEHLRWENLLKSDRDMLYKNVRTAPERLDDKNWKELQSVDNISDAAEIIFNIDGGTSREIKTLLSDALDEMVERGGVAGITKGTHGKGEMTIEEKNEYNKLLKQDPNKAGEFRRKVERRRELARESVINFMYNFLTSKISNYSRRDAYLDTKDGTKQSKIGSIESDNLNMWINDQNEKIAKEIIKVEKSINPNLTDKEIVEKIGKLKIFLNNEKHKQAIKNGLEDYLKKFKKSDNETDDQRIKREKLKTIAQNLIAGERIGSGYDVEVSGPIFERKLREKIQNILKERFTILQEEEDDLGFLSGDINKQLEVYKNSLSDLFSSGTYNTEKLTNIVKQIIETGQAPKNLNSENLAAHKGVYNFIITMLASVYGNLNTSEKRNVISYIFVSAFPRGENSNFINFLMSKAKLKPSSRARDMVWDAILGGTKNLTSIERALNNYTPSEKNFNNFLITIIRNETVDLLRKSKDTRTGYLEDPTGSSEEGYSNTLLDKLGDESEYQQRYGSDDEDVIKIANSLKKFMKENLSKKEFEMFLLLKDDEVSGTGRTGKTKFNISMAATALDISNVNARVIKSRLTDKLEKFIESGELREFVLNETGLDISGYTKIQDYLDNKLDKLESDSEDNEEMKDDYHSNEDDDDDDDNLDVDVEDEDFGDDDF
jgi:DNA-directed RNA polymerase specialized sigma24 family protein